jgi:hypothetical protein
MLKRKFGEVLTFVDRFTALRFTATGAIQAARRIRILSMPIGRQHSERSSYNPQITGAAENAIPVNCGSILPSQQTVETNFKNEPC